MKYSNLCTEDFHSYIESIGYYLRFKNNTPLITDDSGGVVTEVEFDAAIAGYDPLPYTKQLKTAELKAEGLSRIQAIFPAVKDFDDLDLVREQWLSIAPAARQATADFQRMIDVVQAGKAAKTAINALTTEAEVLAYDVVNAPAWPV